MLSKRRKSSFPKAVQLRSVGEQRAATRIERGPNPRPDEDRGHSPRGVGIKLPPVMFARSRCIASKSPVTAASSARRCRTDIVPFCRLRPIWATVAFPSLVRGPVECSQGRFLSADSLSL